MMMMMMEIERGKNQLVEKFQYKINATAFDVILSLLLFFLYIEIVQADFFIGINIKINCLITFYQTDN